jgi:hypothetical protein
MDDLVSAYFNVYGCEAIQENFALLGEKRYVVSEAPFQIYGPPAHGPSDAEKVAIGKPYATRKKAKSRADKLDQEIGGYRYQVRRTPEPPVNEEVILECILDLLVNEGYTNSYESAACILEVMSDEWYNSLIEEIRLTGQVEPHLKGNKRVIPASAFEDPNSKEAKEKAERRAKRGRLTFKVA